MTVLGERRRGKMTSIDADLRTSSTPTSTCSICVQAIFFLRLHYFELQTDLYQALIQNNMSGINNAGTTQPPPQHPASGQTGTSTAPAATSAHTVHDGSGGAQAANSESTEPLRSALLMSGLGDKVKGGWNVFHGTGEGIRGNINSFVDNVGEQIAGRGQGDAKPPTRTEEERPAQVAAKGADELRAGLNQFEHKQ